MSSSLETPSSLVRRRLAGVSIVDEEWQFGPLRFWEPFEDDSGKMRGHYLPVCADAGGVVLGAPEILPMPVDAGACAAFLLKTCQELNCRPARWTIADEHLSKTLAEWLPEDARIDFHPVPDAWGEVVCALAGLGGLAPSGIFEGTEVQPSDMLAFCNAAAAFYRRRPWKKLPPETLLLIDPIPDGELPPAVLVIHTETVTGLVGLESVEALCDLDDSDQMPASSWCLNFMPRRELPWQDRQDFERHDWPVAFRKAHPLLLRFVRELPLRHARRDELRFFTFLLLAITHTTPRLAQGAPVEMNITGGLGEAHFSMIPVPLGRMPDVEPSDEEDQDPPVLRLS